MDSNFKKRKERLNVFYHFSSKQSNTFVVNTVINYSEVLRLKQRCSVLYKGITDNKFTKKISKSDQIHLEKSKNPPQKSQITDPRVVMHR